MLNGFTFFHLNLMYSSIDREHHKNVIEKCYWPILHLAERNVPVAVEAAAITLEMIADADPSWILRCRELLREGKIEFIGSGYAQIIGPLVPWKVNQWNYTIAGERYLNILGVQPTIALVNEMAFSAGMIEHYLNAGYRGIAMEWNNTYKYHPEWPKSYQYRALHATNGESDISLLWCNSIVFQKFQRYAHGETTLDEFMTYLRRHNSEQTRFISLYSGDAEIFDFRPGRYETEKKLGTSSEWKRIFAFYELLQREPDFTLVFPSTVLEKSNHKMEKPISLESAEQPIPVKKQEKYNIIRWALTGRADQQINTLCHRIFEKIKTTSDKEFQKKLCYFWASDFRTHITDTRWAEFKNDFHQFCDELNISRDAFSSDTGNTGIAVETFPFEHNVATVSNVNNAVQISSPTISFSANLMKGMTIEGLTFHRNSVPDITTLKHGYYDDIAYGVDFFSGHAIIEEAAKHKVTNLCPCVSEVQIENDTMILQAETTVAGYTFFKQIQCNVDDGTITFHTKIDVPNRKPRLIRPIHFTFNPDAFDMSTLYYATHNGGRRLEKFQLADRQVDQTEALSLLISAKYGLGATEGIVCIGDKNHELCFYHDNTVGYMIPSIKFVRVDENKYFLRLQYSAQEIDETFVPDDKTYCLQTKVRVGAQRGCGE
ncbi:MAG: glycoside hydrolase family 57 [Deltaproteobacteria bacterium]|nr:glycoside hydrolase family 57 [Deltaproteobacteria bacterium]MBN2674614.1 glycoside hydrolase family 57 [Deltaproteobacteria bacterium]